MGEALGVEGGGWRPKEVEGVEREMEAVRKVAGQVGEEMEREAKRKVDTAVEDVKRVRFLFPYLPSSSKLTQRVHEQHRELYINLRDLFTRQTLLGVDNVPKLQKRVETNLAKVRPPPPLPNLLTPLLTPFPRPFTASAALPPPILNTATPSALLCLRPGEVYAANRGG